MKEQILEIEKYAKENNVPIIEKESICYIMKYIKEHNVKNILEIGSAIGYSAILMASSNQPTMVTTIERDESRYMECLKNIKKCGLDKKINVVYQDALDVNLTGVSYDLIFIDAAKAQNTKFFEKFERNLRDGGSIITDNMYFHGLVFKDEEDIGSRNLRQLVRKVKNYTLFLEKNNKYDTEFLNIGDGLAISIKK